MGKITNEELFKEIDLIQACINRMAQYSFLIKGWVLTLFAGITAVLGKQLLTTPWWILGIMLLSLLGFWYLDTFFLTTERQYRKLYEWVLKKRIKENDTDRQYELDPSQFKEYSSVWKVMFSKTLMIFYGIPTFILIVLLVVLLLQAYA